MPFGCCSDCRISLRNRPTFWFDTWLVCAAASCCCWAMSAFNRCCCWKRSIAICRWSGRRFRFSYSSRARRTRVARAEEQTSSSTFAAFVLGETFVEFVLQQRIVRMVRVYPPVVLVEQVEEQVILRDGVVHLVLELGEKGRRRARLGQWLRLEFVQFFDVVLREVPIQLVVVDHASGEKDKVRAAVTASDGSLPLGDGLFDHLPLVDLFFHCTMC